MQFLVPEPKVLLSIEPQISSELRIITPKIAVYRNFKLKLHATDIPTINLHESRTHRS